MCQGLLDIVGAGRAPPAGYGSGGRKATMTAAACAFGLVHSLIGVLQQDIG